MAIISDFEEQDSKPSAAAAASKPFKAVLDPADPLGFLQAAFEFVGRESDLFKSDSLINDVNAVVRMVKDKLLTEERKRKVEAEASSSKAAGKKVKEDVPVAAAKKEEVKEAKGKEVMKEAKEVDKNGTQGNGFCESDEFSLVI